MIPVIENIGANNWLMNPSARKELEENNCTMPDIDRVIFNLGEKARPQTDPETGKFIKDENNQLVYGKPEPVLATTVYFVDDTKVTVLNSTHDGLTFQDKKLSDGSVIQLASDQAKELGIAYAWLKRYVSKPDENGKMVDSGLGRILKELVANAYDTKLAGAEAKIAKAAAQKRQAELKANAKPKRERYSLEGTLARINALLDKAEAGDVNAKSVLDKVTEVWKD